MSKISKECRTISKISKILSKRVMKQKVSTKNILQNENEKAKKTSHICWDKKYSEDEMKIKVPSSSQDYQLPV